MPRKNATSDRLDRLEERLSRIEEAVHRLPKTAPDSSWAHLILAGRQLLDRATAGRPAGLGPFTGAGEEPVEPWKHLVRRPHPWRKQLSLRGRNLTARQLVGGMHANNLDEQAAAANYQVPVEAIREATEYVEKNRQLLEAEAEIERLMLTREGVSRGPRPVP